MEINLRAHCNNSVTTGSENLGSGKPSQDILDTYTNLHPSNGSLAIGVIPVPDICNMGSQRQYGSEERPGFGPGFLTKPITPLHYSYTNDSIGRNHIPAIRRTDFRVTKRPPWQVSCTKQFSFSVLSSSLPFFPTVRRMFCQHQFSTRNSLLALL